MELRAEEAVVLRHLDYGEADRIVTFYSAAHGRIKGFARGARKSRKRFGAALEPFSRVRLHWSPPRSGELIHLREVELIDLRAGLRQDLMRLALAGYGCELVEEFFGEGQAHPQVYGLLQAFLDHLAGGGAPVEARLLCELRLLALAGYAPHLLHCAECGSSLTPPMVAFDAARGGSLCGHCAPSAPRTVSLPTLGTLGRILQTPPDRFAGFRLSETTRREGFRLLAAALALHLPRPMKSLAFLERVGLGDEPPPAG